MRYDITEKGFPTALHYRKWEEIMEVPTWIYTRYMRWEVQKSAYNCEGKKRKSGKWPAREWVIKDRLLFPLNKK